MTIAVERFKISDVVAITPHRIRDDRGYFVEVFKRDWFAATIAQVDFVQENQSLSQTAGTLRGLHFQTDPFAQGKLVRCDAGAIFDVAVDIRAGSPTYGQWVGVELSPENGKQLWIPAGFAHGFCTLQPNSVITYKVTASYSRDNDKGIAWDDSSIGIDWPSVADASTLSPKDLVQPALAGLPAYFKFTQPENV